MPLRLWQRLRSLVVPSVAKSRMEQEELDLAKLRYVMEIGNFMAQHKRLPGEDEHCEMLRTLARIKPHAARQQVHDSIHDQLLRVLQAVHDANRQCHDSLRLLVAAPEETRGGERHDPDMFQAAVSRQHEGAVEQHLLAVRSWPEARAASLRDRAGFALSVTRERASPTGASVSLTGRVLPGTVLCIYPGRVYMPEFLGGRDATDALRNRPPFMLMSRTDRAVIDGSDTDLHMLLRNPLAVGHMVRHPPRASTPNVLPFSYSVPLGARGAPGMPSELFQLWPNRFYQEPDTLSSPTMQLNPCAMPSLVLVAMREIQDEELLLDYRLNPALPAPEWYAPVNADEIARLWRAKAK